MSCSNGYVRFGQDALRKFTLKADSQTVRVQLSWNSWPSGTQSAGTEKDLDLQVFSGQQVLAQSEEVQIVEGAEQTDKTSLLPYEQVEVKLNKGTYSISIPCKSNNFDASRDRLTLVVTTNKPYALDENGDEKSPLELAAYSTDSVLPPLDGSPLYSFGVGDLSRYSSRGSVYDIAGRALKKPELVLEKSIAEYSDGATIEGPDVAAARLAAAVVLMRAAEPDFSQKHLAALGKESAPLMEQDEAAAITPLSKKASLINQGFYFPEDWQGLGLPAGFDKVLAKVKDVYAIQPQRSGELVPWVLATRTPPPEDLFSGYAAQIGQAPNGYVYYVQLSANRGSQTVTPGVIAKTEVLARRAPWHAAADPSVYFELRLITLHPRDTSRRPQTRRWKLHTVDTLREWMKTVGR